MNGIFYTHLYERSIIQLHEDTAIYSFASKYLGILWQH